MKRTTSTGAQRARPPAVRALTGILVFLGIGAVGGGAAFLADTSGGVAGMSTEVLARTPFSTYLWPGLLLSLGLGVPALVTAVGVHRRGAPRIAAPLERATGRHWSWSCSLALGVALMSWIVVQVLLIDERSALQPTMFVTGGALVGLPLVPAVRRDLAVTRR